MRKYISLQLDPQSLPNMICHDCIAKLKVVSDFHETCDKSESILNELRSMSQLPDASDEEEVSVLKMEKDNESFSYVLPKGLKIKRVSHCRPTTFWEEQSLESHELVETKEDPQVAVEAYPEPEDVEERDTERPCFFFIRNINEVEERNTASLLAQQEYLETPKKIAVDLIEAAPFEVAELGTIPKHKDELPPILQHVEMQTDADGVTKAVIRVKRNLTTAKLNQNVCKICGNAYRFPHLLATHVKRHLEDKAYCCDVCGKRFVIPFELKRHQRVHNGAKPYSCQFCQREFADYSSKAKHERTHTGHRPYSCKLCSKSFSYSHVLNSHLLTHTGERKYGCEVCNKRFVKSHHLKNHLKVHEKPMQQPLSLLELNQGMEVIPELIDGEGINILTQFDPNNYQLVEVFEAD